MKQHGYLFLGGPLDQQWRDVARVNAVVVAVECATGPDTARMAHYCRYVILMSGWFVPIEVFTTDPLRGIDPGTPMPGWIEGGALDCWPVDLGERPDGDYPSWHESRQAMHAAIKARGFRP